MSTTLMALKASSEALTADQKRIAESKRNIIILIYHYLLENGYVESAERVQKEGGAVMTKFEVADNIDLSLILSEYEAYYEMRFEKKPKLVRKSKDDDQITAKAYRKAQETKKTLSRKSNSDLNDNGSVVLPTLTNSTNGSAQEDSGSLNIQGVTCVNEKSKRPESDDKIEERLLKPPPSFGGDAEMKQLANVISREIYQESPNVRFEDVICLDEAKRLLCEAVQLPIRFPSLFTGILRPWKGILLHGPPGTGKTLLAKAVATECRTTFFNISASTLVSKWRGDSEKLVRVLFELARHHAPSTIFLDEIDSILTSRGSDGGGSEHEASRRMKTELLIQMDGTRASKANEQVFVMAASNLPWDLDVALLRRLEKRVFVSLPEYEARVAMIKKHLSCRAVNELDYDKIAQCTEGYSGADIELLCREAAMMPVRRLMTKLTDLSNRNDSTSSIAVHKKDNYRASTVNSSIASSQTHAKYGIQKNDTVGNDEILGLLLEDLVTQQDIITALETTRPSSDGNIGRYREWQNDYGSV